MRNTVELAKEIFSRFGTVKRARRCFLYTTKGERLTDMYQEGGRAILGWGGSVFTVFKNVLERGVTGSYFTDFSSPCGKPRSRLARAVSSFFGDEREVFVFPSKRAALNAALSVSADSTSIYRPWNPQEIDWRGVSCIVFVPPFPWTDSIYVLAVKKGVSETPYFEDEVFLVSPLCAAVTRSVYDLSRALQEREEKHWFIYDKIITKYWERKGPYLFPKIPESEYADFVLHCLDCNLVISPDYNQPSIVPFGADKGNFSKLQKNPFIAEEPAL